MTEELKEMVESILDDTHDFYTVEHDAGRTYIRPDRYFYCAGSPCTNADSDEIYRELAFYGAYIDIKQMKEYDPDSKGYVSLYEEETAECSQYIGDLTLLDCARQYLEFAKKATPLPMNKVTEDTEDGWYLNLDCTQEELDDIVETVEQWIKEEEN